MTTVDTVSAPVEPEWLPPLGWRDEVPAVPTAEEVLSWPVSVPLPVAGRCWHLGRDASYDLARRGQFPVPVLRLGRRLVVTRGSILVALGINEAG